MPRLTVTDPCLPIGNYLCDFVGAVPVTHEQWGDGLQWTFKVVKGALAGREAFRTTKPEPTIKNSCGKFLAALAGASPSDGLDVDTDDFVGCRYAVMVGASQDGKSTRIETFVPENDES